MEKSRFMACKAFMGNLRAEILSFDGTYNESILIPLITRVLEERTWTKIVTHNQSGEYGHYRHVNLHNVLARLCPEKLWVFDRDTDTPVAPDILEIKNHILTNVYQSQNHILKWFDWNHETIVKY